MLHNRNYLIFNASNSYCVIWVYLICNMFDIYKFFQFSNVIKTEFCLYINNLLEYLIEKYTISNSFFWLKLF